MWQAMVIGVMVSPVIMPMMSDGVGVLVNAREQIHYWYGTMGEVACDG